MRKILFEYKYVIITAVVLVALSLVPFPASKMHIRLTGNGFADGHYHLYYTTVSDGAYSQDKCVEASKQTPEYVDFVLDGDLKGEINGLRFDFPDAEQTMCVTAVEFKSAGVIKKSINPCRFFSSKNIAVSNSISALDMIESRNQTFIATQKNDPYLIITAACAQGVNKFFSTYVLTRLLFSLLVIIGLISYKKHKADN